MLRAAWGARWWRSPAASIRASCCAWRSTSSATASVALTTRSPTAPEDDEAIARALAAALGVRHLVIDANELEIPGYAANPINRCYFCKDSLYEICARRGARSSASRTSSTASISTISATTGPGLQAAEEHGVRHPLVEVGLSQGRDPRAQPAARPADRGQAVEPVPVVALPVRHARSRSTACARSPAAERVLRRLGFPRVPRALPRPDRAHRGAAGGAAAPGRARGARRRSCASCRRSASST